MPTRPIRQLQRPRTRCKVQPVDPRVRTNWRTVVSGKAVVVGASIAGLAAARVLSDHYGSVVVLERDELPDTSAPRHGVPQGAHAHILTAAGLREFERLLPGFRADLIAAGGTAIDICAELYASRYNRAWPPVPSE